MRKIVPRVPRAGPIDNLAWTRRDGQNVQYARVVIEPEVVMVSRIEVKSGLVVLATTISGIVLVVLGWFVILGRFIAYCCFLATFVHVAVIAALRGKRFVCRMADWDDPDCRYTLDG